MRVLAPSCGLPLGPPSIGLSKASEAFARVQIRFDNFYVNAALVSNPIPCHGNCVAPVRLSSLTNFLLGSVRLSDRRMCGPPPKGTRSKLELF